MSSINIKTELKKWARHFTGRIGTEYPCNCAGIKGAARVSAYGLMSINVDRAEAIERIVMRLFKINERQYDILLSTYTRKMSLKEILDEMNMGKSQYYTELSNAEHFVLGALDNSFYA